ncbi:hypothetical protein [Streptomyces sp. NPDC005012]|uniref:hypothetical protein n=1 Tax=Streptomyces sp. NPDC005012 TaxID=3154558 RepID=UPI0033A93050
MGREGNETAGLEFIATQCVEPVEERFGRRLGRSLRCLGELDRVCAALPADGPLSEERPELWGKLVGTYTGEVLVRAYGGSRITHEQSPVASAVEALGVTGFPFGIAHKVLSGEESKSLNACGRWRCLR